MRQFGRMMFLGGVLAIAAACQSGNSGESANQGGEGGSRTFAVAFVTNSASDFWTIARRGVEKADAELNDVTAEFRITSDGTPAEQRRIIDDLLTKGVDAIAISPADPVNQTAFINDASKKALIIVPTMVVSKSNVEEFTTRINELRGRSASE